MICLSPSLPQPSVGARVRIIGCSDPWSQRSYGLEGTVTMVDDAGTIFVDWDDGSGFGLVPGRDAWELL